MALTMSLSGRMLRPASGRDSFAKYMSFSAYRCGAPLREKRTSSGARTGSPRWCCPEAVLRLPPVASSFENLFDTRPGIEKLSAGCGVQRATAVVSIRSSRPYLRPHHTRWRVSALPLRGLWTRPRRCPRRRGRILAVDSERPCSRVGPMQGENYSLALIGSGDCALLYCSAFSGSVKCSALSCVQSEPVDDAAGTKKEFSMFCLKIQCAKTPSRSRPVRRGGLGRDPGVLGRT